MTDTDHAMLWNAVAEKNAEIERLTAVLRWVVDESGNEGADLDSIANTVRIALGEPAAAQDRKAE